MADPRVEDLLALIGNDEDEQEAPKQHNPVAELRQQLKQVLKEKKETEKLAAQLQEELNVYRGEKENQVFSSLRLTDKQRDLYKSTAGDASVSAEAVMAWMAEYGISVPSEDASGEGSEEAPSVDAAASSEAPASGFTPTVVPGTAPGQKMYTSEEWDALYKQNPNQAHQVLREGRILRDERWPGTNS